MLANLIADVRYSLRGLAKQPLFASVVVLTLAFGIGVNVAVYSIFEQILLRPLPVGEPERLVNLEAPGPKPGNNSCNQAGHCDRVFSYPMFRDLERTQEPFAGIAAHRLVDANLALDGQTLHGTGVLVSGSYFGLLGLQPALGRLLGPQDDRVDGEAEAAVLGYAYWQNDLGADPAVLGQTLVVNGRSLTVVGVAPPGFQGTTLGVKPEVFVPITFRWLDRPGSTPNHDNRRNYWVYLFARLKPGVSVEQAEAAINPPYRAILNEIEAPLQEGMSEQTLERFRAKTLELTPGTQGQSGAPAVARRPLTLLLVATATVLLIACVNIANLMLARGATRVGEMAVRLSMGAAPRRLMTLLSTESLLLALAAALVSLPLTLATLQWITTMLPAENAATFDFGLDASKMLLAVGAALLCALIFGLLPVLKLARTQPAKVLQAQGTRSIGGKAAARFRVSLVTTQIALSMMLLVLAGLLTQSLANISRVDLGIRVESLSSFSIAPELNGYTPERSAALFDRVEEELAALPGVTSVASSLVTLLAGNNWGASVSVEGFEASPDADTNAHVNFIGSGFFRTLGVPLLAGRDFAAADAGLERPKVAIVNQRFVERFGLGENAIGNRIAVFSDELDIEIVGVARDAKYSDVKDDVRPQVFRPRSQIAGIGAMTFYVRSATDPDQALAAIPRLIARLDPNLPVTSLREVERQARENVFLDRFVTTLAASLAVLATLLAALGLYGVLSYMVAQRTREIGLRVALGAPPERLRAMVLRQVAQMGVIGGTIGLAAALLLGRAASTVLFGVESSDPRVMLVAVAVLAAVVLGAGYWPARRASRIDPMIALRSE